MNEITVSVTEMDKEELQRLKQNLLEEARTLHVKHRMGELAGKDYFEPGMSTYSTRYDSVYDDDSEILILCFEAENTGHDGRTERIEDLKTGDALRIIQRKAPDPGREGRKEGGVDYPYRFENTGGFTLFDQKGRSVGDVPDKLSQAFTPLYDAGALAFISARVSFVDPLSKRSRHARRAVLFAELSCRFTGRRQKQPGVKSGKVKAKPEQPKKGKNREDPAGKNLTKRIR